MHIDDGFDFLGANIRKYNGKLLMRPTRENISGLVGKTRSLIRQLRGTTTDHLLGRLNPLLQGWAHQFRHLVAAKTFQYIDHCVFTQLWKWARRRHNNKGRRWVKAKYFSVAGNDRWAFHAQRNRARESPRTITLFRMSTLPIRRHIKVRSEARYHDARYAEYFKVLLPRYRRIGMQACREWNSQQLELNL